MPTARPLPHRFSVDEFERMAGAGLFGDDARVELLDGEIIDMAPIGPHHASTVDRLAAALMRAVGKHAIVRVRAPVRLGELSEPQPDVSLLRHRDDFYWDRHPEPGDVLAVIEVADTSVAFDRDRKAPLYARAGIPVCWLVDVGQQVVRVLTGPGPGGYTGSATVGRDGSLDAVVATLAASDFLPS